MSTINICMTSYPKRITNCAKVIQSVLENTVLPDRIYLTLSSLEFPRYEQDLPLDLYRLTLTSDRVILNWVDTNWKSFKKVFPVLPYLEDDDIIIDIDDDMLLPRDFIESRMKDFKDNGCSSPITSNHSRTMNVDSLVVSAYSLFQKKMLDNYDMFLNDTVLNTFNDDRTYLYLLYMNGYKPKPCTKWCVQGNVQKLDLMPPSGYRYDAGNNYDVKVAATVKILSEGKDISKCFNLFNETNCVKSKKDIVAEGDATKLSMNNWNSSGICQNVPAISPNTKKLFQYNLKNPVKHDLVYVLGKGSKFNNMEIKISITSMLKFCSHWIGDIYVVGENPKIRNPKVKHIYAPDITKSNKDANIINKILVAIRKIPSLSDNFLFCSDDILVTRKSDWEDFSPRYVFEYRQDDKFRDELKKGAKDNKWDTLLLKTLDRFVGCRDHIYFYEPHIFAPINKQYFREMCRRIDYLDSRDVIIMSLWFNWLNIQEPQPKFDHKSVFTQNVPEMSNLPRHVSYNDKAFSVKKFREGLVDLVTMEEFK